MDFKVISNCYNNAQGQSGHDCDFYLEEDSWNDFSYHTMYHLHATKRLTGLGSNEYLGYIRIMRIGQKEKQENLVREVTGGRVFSKLPDDFVSLSLNVNLFHRLHTLLNPEQRIVFTNALNLIVGSTSPLLEKVEHDDCFYSSLLRDGASIDGFHMSQIESYMLGTAVFYDLRAQTISVKFSHIPSPVSLKFSCGGKKELQLPDGVVVFIGKNGSGKSTAMYKLARLIYEDPTKRFDLEKDVGKIEPSDIGVIKLLIFSYTPFDNFYLPGMQDDNLLAQLKNDCYDDCDVLFNGIRDVRAEMDVMQRGDRKPGINGRVEQIKLKPNESLSAEFQLAVNLILERGNKREMLWNTFVNQCRSSQPNLYEDIQRILSAADENVSFEFSNTATGHKFILHSIARLIAYIEENSLALFDEPENHLHPPLLSFYFSQVRRIMDEFGSVVFISTHSPVIVQETFAQNVFIVRRIGGQTEIMHPEIETYGASISSITAEVFDLTTDLSGTYGVFNRIFNNELLFLEDTPEQMLAKFKGKIGSEISGPMESYLLNLYFEQNKDNVET